jgi:hypothetical protein
MPKDFSASVKELSTSPSVPGFGADTLDDIENGQGNPTLGVVIALAQAMDVQPEQLCEGMFVEVEAEQEPS